jgi:hypothetical protein
MVLMTRNLFAAIYIGSMIAIIIGVDLLFFRQRIWIWERLAANVGIVLVFMAFYFRFMRNP